MTFLRWSTFWYNLNVTIRKKVKRLNFLWTLLFMTFIGALIGGFTNHLAIRMLFRPHTAKYIGSWRLPFTPGLIPKRRDELAMQLGKTVTKYLLTPETFKKKLLTSEMEAKAEDFIQKQLETHVLHSERTLQEWFELAGAPNIGEKVEKQALTLMNEQLEAVRTKITAGTVEEVVPLKWREEAEKKIPQVTEYILAQADGYFQSADGRAMLQKLIDDFLASKGTLGGMVNMFFGESDTLVSKVQREALKFIAAPGTFTMLNSIIVNEWTKLQKRPVEELLQGFDWDGLFYSIETYMKKELAIESRLEKPLSAYWTNAANWTATNFTPVVTRFLFDQAEFQLETSLRKLKIDDMVKEQVDTFPVHVLEDLMLGISRREFKMITVLGAVLGGAIGIVQGLIVFVLNLS